MPIYEYQCGSCGQRFERLQKFSDPPVDTCPACGGAVERLLSSPAIQFKGSGFYITDYVKSARNGKDKSADGGGKDAGQPAPAADKPATTPAESSGGSTGASKSAAASKPAATGSD